MNNFSSMWGAERPIFLELQLVEELDASSKTQQNKTKLKNSQ